MKTLFFLIALSTLSTCFASNTDPVKGGPTVISITLPVFGKGGFDTNTSKICPDRCFLCDCGSITIDLFRVPDSGTPFDLKGEKGVYQLQGHSWNVEVLSDSKGEKVSNEYHLLDGTPPLQVKVL